MKKLIALLLAAVLCVGLFAGCAQEKNEDLTKAKEYLYSLYVDAALETATDLEYPARVKGGNTFFDVEWTVEITAGSGEIKVTPSTANEGFVVVDVPEETPEDITYKLTATIKSADGKQTETLTYEHKIPKFTLTSFAEYAAAESGTLIVAQGVVTAILSKSNGDSSDSLYFQNDEGGFYAYNLSSDPVADGIEVGMTVRVTGQKDLYNGTYEIVSGTAQIIDSNKTPATPADFTEIYKNAADLKDASLTTQQSFLVTIKGVEITKQEDKYLKFKLGDKETYIYISSSNCPGTAEDEANLINTYNEKGGNLANVTGLITLYNGAFYLTPVGPDAFEYLGLPTKSDAEMVEYEMGNLELPNTVTKDTVIDLAAAGATYDQVAIAWAVEGEGAAITDGQLVITMPDKDSVITLTATLTCGSETQVITFQIKLSAKTPSYEEIVDMAYGLETGASLDGTYRLFGVITSIDTVWSDQYKNITVTIQIGDMADKKIMCFRLKGDGAESLQVGDAITVEGTLKNYNGTIEFDSGCQLIGMGEIVDQSKTVQNAYALAAGEKQEHATLLVGTITSIDTAWSDQYQNITVTIVVDGLSEYPIMCYRLKGEGAANLAVGDEIAVLGYIKNYNGTIEFDSGCKLVNKEEASAIRTVLEAYALAAGESLYANKTLTGVITAVNTEWSEQYQNITVTIVVAGLEDFPIECFRLKGEGAATLKVGDVITVTGELLRYVNKDGTTDKIEFNSGCQLIAVTAA